MTLICARCGAQNPDGNQFCQACGTPLTPAVAGAPQAPPAPPSWLAAPPQAPPPPAAAAPPLAYASPPPLPVAYASPYYTPAAAAPPVAVHRTPWMLIIAAVVGLVVVMAGCGTAIALLGNKASSSSGIAGDVPSPTPAGSPSPVASPTAPQGPTASNDAEIVPVPAGWAVASKDANTIGLTDPSGLGVMAVVSGVQNPTMSAQQQKADLDSSLKGKYPDTIQCGNTHTTNGSLGGVPGLFWQLCFTLVSGGRSLPAEASMFVGTNADGSIFYGVILMTAQTYMQNFTTESAPILKGIVWKLK
jgi:hypothetical protein